MKRKSRKRHSAKPHLKLSAAVPFELIESFLKQRRIPINPVNGFVTRRSWDLNTGKTAYSLADIISMVELHGHLETISPEVTGISLTFRLTKFAKWMIGWGVVCVGIAVIASSSILVFLVGVSLLIFASLLVDFLILLWLALRLRFIKGG